MLPARIIFLSLSLHRPTKPFIKIDKKFFSFRLRLLLCCLGVVGSLSLCSQRSLIRTYTVGDGLVMNRIRGFHQDKEGFIWIYTWDGLSRYEGYRFRNYISGRDLQHSFVNDIFEAGEGKVYLPLNDGSLAVMENLNVVRVLVPGDIINNFSTDEEGNIYAATDHYGIQLFENEVLVPVTSNVPVISVTQFLHYNDHFFFIGPFKDLSGVLDEQMNRVASWHGPAGYFNAIYQDHNDRIFVCTMNGIKEVDLTSSSFDLKETTAIPPNAPWKHWDVSSVIVTPENEMWIGTNQGLVHLYADMTWKVMTVQDGLLSNIISALFLDKSGTLWIGTDAGAASINLQTQIEDNRDLPGLYCNFVLPVENGTAYAITAYSYLNHVNKQVQIVHSENVGNDSMAAIALYPGQESLLLFKHGSIEKLDPLHYVPPQVDSEDAGIYAMHDDRFWLASMSGFVCADSSGPFKPVGSLYFATCIGSKGEHLIVGTWQEGLFVAKPDASSDSCRLEKIRDLTMWIDDPRIRSLLISKEGDIWIGTRFSGLIRLRCNNDYTDCKAQSFSITDGLVSNWITSVVEDQYGNVWVGSVSGIDKLIPKSDGYFAFPFSRINGFYANVRHLAIHPDGSLWVGHNEGLARIVDGRIDTIGPPVTYITEVTLGGNDSSVYQSSPVSLRYDQNSAHFAFAAPDYINTSQLMFTYRLLGSKDTAWSLPVRTHEIFYGNLTPGRFKFEVAAFGWNGVRGHSVSYAFEIMRPFWKQPWFILLSMLLTGAALVGLYRLRISQIHKVQAVRDRIATDLHDEIASSLTHINILSEIGKHEYPQSNGAPDLFDRIGSEVQTSSEALDDIIWSIKTRRDAIGDVIARMRQYAHEIFERAEISFQLHANVDGIHSLEMEFKRDFYLIYKELLRNILRHAEANHVEIKVDVNRFQVAIHVRDDGKGFDLLAPTDRSGLSNIKARVEKWNGVATWQSAPGKGTTVDVEMHHG